MLSAKDMAAVKTAIVICNNCELKQEILCASESYFKLKRKIGRKHEWDEIVEKKAKVILEKLEITKQLKEIVISIVLLVGGRMLNWAVYHGNILGISPDYFVNFLNCSFFTQQGTIDNKKAAEELMKDGTLKIEQKYKLACLYCFAPHIPTLFVQMKEKFESPHKIQQPKFVEFWSYYLMGEIDKIKGEKNLNQYRLEQAVRSGSKAAVEYCLNMENNFIRKRDAIMDAAVEAVKCRTTKQDHDGDIFMSHLYGENSWVPMDYYVDIFAFLLSKMEKDQLIEFLKQDIEGAKYNDENTFSDKKRSRVLKYFLNWPYQVYFMKMAEMMWEFLPEKEYTVLLFMICDKIESKEERSYDYRVLLNKFWSLGPEHYKRYVFSSQKERFLTNRGFITETGTGLLAHLFTLENFMYQDRENIELILASATSKEKKNIFSSEKWKDLCLKLMMIEKWEMLDRFVLNYFLSKEEKDRFKRELSLTEKAQRVCLDFVKNDNWNAAESFIKWSSLPEEGINQFKKEMILSENGRKACRNLILLKEKVKCVDLIRWCFFSEKEIKAFKRELATHEEICRCINFVEEGFELANELINFCLSSEGEVRELKRNVAYEIGSSLCQTLLSKELQWNSMIQRSHDGNYGVRETFESKWVKVEKFLTWGFSSEKEISEFKKNELLRTVGKDIHFNLIRMNLWEEAERYFAWLDLSAEEIKELKKDTLFYHDAASSMFKNMIYAEEDDEIFDDYGSKPEAIELFLRWFLTDKETVIEFKHKFKRIIYERDIRKYFGLMIKQHLRDIKEEERKSETLPLKCNLKLEISGGD